MGQRVNKQKLDRLHRTLMDACCAGCGQALVRREVEPMERTPQQHAIIWPIAMALAQRAAVPPKECPKCGRPIERYDWGWMLQFATDNELEELGRALVGLPQRSGWA